MLDDEESTMESNCDERPLTSARMAQIWKRVKVLRGDNELLPDGGIGYDGIAMNEALGMNSDDDADSAIGTEVQEAIHVAMNTNMDPNQYGDKVYLTYGVDMNTLKKRAKTKRKK